MSVFDTMVADYLLAPGQRNHSIDDLAKRYLQHETIKISELIGTGKNQKRMDEVPVELVTPYAGEDALCRCGWPTLGRRLERRELDELFYSLELPLIEVLAEMEFNGIQVDVTGLQRLSQQYGRADGGAGARDLSSWPAGLQHRFAEAAGEGAV